MLCRSPGLGGRVVPFNVKEEHETSIYIGPLATNKEQHACVGSLVSDAATRCQLSSL